MSPHGKYLYFYSHYTMLDRFEQEECDGEKVNFNHFDQSAYLFEGIRLGIINTNTVLDDIGKVMRRKKILENHKYAISTVTIKGTTYYQTNLPTEDGRRTIRRKKTLKELQDAIVEFYMSKEKVIRLDTVFREWTDQRTEYGDIKGESLDRYENDYRRFIENSPIADFLKKKPFCRITEEDLERFLKVTIREIVGVGRNQPPRVA